MLAQTIRQSFSLSQHLNSELPNTIQYHAGETIELYCANIGQDYFLTIFFDVQSRRGRIGTIWVFTQRAIKDLLEQLPQTTALPPTARPTPLPAQTGAKAQPTQPPTPTPAAAARKETPELVQNEEIAAMVAAMIASQENGQVNPEETESDSSEWLIIDTAELENLFGEDFPDDSTNADLDAFWESAFAQDDDNL